MGDFRPGMAKFGERTLARQMGVDPPRETEFGVPSQRGGVDPPRDTDFGVVSPGKGQRVDVTA
jgi:hypothetical protein